MPHKSDPIVQKIFLISSAKPDQNGIGTIFIRDILKTAPEIDVHWRVVAPFMLGTINAKTGFVMRLINALMTRLSSVNDIRLAVFISWRLKAHAEALEMEYRRSGASAIWVTTSSPEIICLAEELMQRGIDMRVTVWDAPQYLFQNLRLSKRRSAQILDRFWALLRKSQSCSVVSDSMKDEYATQIPTLPIVVMRHGIAPLPLSPEKGVGGVVRIVFAGSLYSKQEWNAFVRALETANWRVAGRDIQLQYVGVFPLKDAVRPRNMAHMPPVSQQDALTLMAHADIGYLPYWLDPSKEFVARTSFPGKMTAYSAAGLAIFHHGPSSSSVTSFLSRYPYGVACHSLQTENILQQLDMLISAMDSDFVHEARSVAMDQELSDTAMMRAFRTLVAATPGAPKDLA